MLQIIVFVTVDISNDKTYIMLEDRLEALFKDPAEYKILERFDWSTSYDDVMSQDQEEFPGEQEV